MASSVLSQSQPRPHLHAQARPRPHSVYFLDSSTSTSTSNGPYLSASTSSARRRTSQTFRSSPLAGPVLSYSSFSELETSCESSLCPGSSTVSSCSSGEGASLKAPQRCKSTGALTTLGEDQSRLKPPMPAWTRSSSRRSLVSVRSSGSLSRSSSISSTSSSTSFPTLASLISLGVSADGPQPRGSDSSGEETHRTHVHRPPELCLSKNDANIYAYRTAGSSSQLSRRHSRLAFSPSPLHPETPSYTPAVSIRSATSDCSASSSCSSSSVTCVNYDSNSVDWRRVRTRVPDESGADGVSGAEKQRRRFSSASPVTTTSVSSTNYAYATPAEKHDWLTATPTPIFSRSALRTQGVVMPISAREHQKARERERSRVNSTTSACSARSTQSAQSSHSARSNSGLSEKGRCGKDAGDKVPNGRDDVHGRITADRADHIVDRACGGGVIGSDSVGPGSKLLKPSKSLSFSAVRNANAKVNIASRRRSIVVRVPSLPFASFLSSSREKEKTKEMKRKDLDDPKGEETNEGNSDGGEEVGKPTGHCNADSSSSSGNTTSTGAGADAGASTGKLDSPPPSPPSESSSSSSSTTDSGSIGAITDAPSFSSSLASSSSETSLPTPSSGSSLPSLLASSSAGPTPSTATPLKYPHHLGISGDLPSVPPASKPKLRSKQSKNSMRTNDLTEKLGTGLAVSPTRFTTSSPATSSTSPSPLREIWRKLTMRTSSRTRARTRGRADEST